VRFVARRLFTRRLWNHPIGDPFSGVDPLLGVLNGFAVALPVGDRQYLIEQDVRLEFPSTFVAPTELGPGAQPVQYFRPVRHARIAADSREAFASGQTRANLVRLFFRVWTGHQGAPHPR
jgi:hypothetical protein